MIALLDSLLSRLDGLFRPSDARSARAPAAAPGFGAALAAASANPGRLPSGDGASVALPDAPPEVSLSGERPIHLTSLARADASPTGLEPDASAPTAEAVSAQDLDADTSLAEIASATRPVSAGNPDQTAQPPRGLRLGEQDVRREEGDARDGARAVAEPTDAQPPVERTALLAGPASLPTRADAHLQPGKTSAADELSRRLAPSAEAALAAVPFPRPAGQGGGEARPSSAQTPASAAGPPASVGQTETPGASVSTLASAETASDTPAGAPPTPHADGLPPRADLRGPRPVAVAADSLDAGVPDATQVSSALASRDTSSESSAGRPVASSRAPLAAGSGPAAAAPALTEPATPYRDQSVPTQGQSEPRAFVAESEVAESEVQESTPLERITAAPAASAAPTAAGDRPTSGPPARTSTITASPSLNAERATVEPRASSNAARSAGGRVSVPGAEAFADVASAGDAPLSRPAVAEVSPLASQRPLDAAALAARNSSRGELPSPSSAARGAVAPGASGELAPLDAVRSADASPGIAHSDPARPEPRTAAPRSAAVGPPAGEPSAVDSVRPEASDAALRAMGRGATRTADDDPPATSAGTPAADGSAADVPDGRAAPSRALSIDDAAPLPRADGPASSQPTDRSTAHTAKPPTDPPSAPPTDLRDAPLARADRRAVASDARGGAPHPDLAVRSAATISTPTGTSVSVAPPVDPAVLDAVPTAPEGSPDLAALDAPATPGAAPETSARAAAPAHGPLPARLAAPAWVGRLDAADLDVRVPLGDDGAVRVQTTREGDGLAVTVRFSDPELQALAASHAPRLREVLEAQLDASVRLSLGEADVGADGRGQGQERAARTAPSSRSVGDAAAGAPARPRGAQSHTHHAGHEWIG